MDVRDRFTSRAERGQVLAIVAGGIFVIIAMVGVVIDGGNAWAQQRETQNRADGIAKAGTVMIQQYLAGGSENGGDVGCAVADAATNAGVDVDTAVYTNYDGFVLTPEIVVPPCNSADAIPAGAQGVKATTSQEFDTYLARVIGVTTMTTTASATAVVGTPAGICPATQGCGVLPLTVPYTTVTCDGQNRQIIGEGQWPLLNLEAGDVPSASNEVVIPLCTTQNGSVGWIDYGCASNLAQMIDNPCNTYINIPSWLHTQTGNVNSLEDNLNQYSGPNVGVAEDADQVLLIPIHDNTCRAEQPEPSCG